MGSISCGVNDRLTHVKSAAELAAQCFHSPPFFNRAAIEFLDTLCAWVLRYHPYLEPVDLWYIGEEIDAPVDSESRRSSRQRLQLLADALVSVIRTHERGAGMDSSPLLGVPGECQVFDCNPDGERGLNDASDKLAHLYFDSKHLLENFQRLHALSCELNTTSTTTDESVTADNLPNEKRPKLTANDRMMRLITDDIEKYVDWTAEHWAQHLNVGPSTVKGTKAWKKIMEWREIHERGRLARQEVATYGTVGASFADHATDHDLTGSEGF